MSYMFYSAVVFNQNISNWNTSNVTNMQGCFYDCRNYNNSGAYGTSLVPLTWNTTKVTNMSYMFSDAKAFNQNISYNSSLQYWNTSNVTTIANIFACTDAAAVFNNASSDMLWILTGLTGLPETLLQASSSSSIYNWRGGYNYSGIPTFVAPLTVANAPTALTTGPINGPRTGFL